MTVTVLAGDSRELLRDLPENSVDAVLTDPPYALVSIAKRFGKPGSAPAKGNTAYMRASRGFMSVGWDNGSTAFDPLFWAEVLRVMRPGAHLMAFGGTRTSHRLVCAIEDAGFEIRDTLFFCYGSGFPKSHNIEKILDAKEERCSCDKDMRGLSEAVDSEGSFSGGKESGMRPGVRGGPNLSGRTRTRSQIKSSVRDMREANSSETAEQTGEATGIGGPLLTPMLEPNARRAHEVDRPPGFDGQIAGELREGGNERTKQPCVEGRRDVSSESRELCGREVCSVSPALAVDGEKRRLRDGASDGDGGVDGASSVAERDGPPHRSPAPEQSKVKSGALAGQQQSQESRTWPVCRGCGKPIIPGGMGTALKPAVEPICLARKPLSEKSVGANVLRWGTGALNIDASRIHAADAQGGEYTVRRRKPGAEMAKTGGDNWRAPDAPEFVGKMKPGRWPANLAHDGSDEVVAAFPSEAGAYAPVTGSEPSMASPQDGPIYSARHRVAGLHHGDSGSAARFFYSAKADAADRHGSSHPTVKPVDLMAYYARLICPPGGTLLDCFAGTGTTGAAAIIEGFDCILMECDPKSVADINRRLAWMRGEGKLTAQERRRPTQTKPPPMPLFGADHDEH